MSYKEEALEFLGITQWHEAGYNGKGIKIMSDEKVCQEVHPDVISPVGFKSKRDHGDDVMGHIKLVAPDATFIAYPMFANSDGKGGYKCDCEEYIKSEGVSVFTTSSTAGTINKYKEEAMQNCIDNGCIFFAAAGNHGSGGIKGEPRSEKFFAVGGVKPTYNSRIKTFDWSNLQKTLYSSVGEELDFVTIAEILGVAGTSFCSPVFAAMCGLVQQFFLENVGRTLKESGLLRFICDNLIDIDIEGFDVRTGNGLFILPAPNEIDVSRYVSEYKESEKMVLKQQLINKDKYSLKCPYDMNAEFVAVHNTANDASARNEVAYMESTNVSTSFHIAVDDVEAIQVIPFDRNAFHAGDGPEGEGNRKGIAVEICYSKSGGEHFEKAKNNAIEVITDILIERNWDITHVKKHQDFSSKYCPHRILDEGWEKFINQIQKRLEEKNMEEANKPSEWAKVAWEWGTKNGVCDGTNPKGAITREQVVQMLYNLFVKGGK